MTIADAVESLRARARRAGGLGGAAGGVARTGTTFGVVIGLFLGVLIADLAVPKHTSTVVATGAAGSPSGVAGTDAAGAPSAGGAGSGGAAAGSGTTGGTGGAAGSGAAGGGSGTLPAADTGGGSAGGAIVGSAGGPGGGGPGTAGGAGSGAHAAAASARGVSSTAIKIGIAYPDISALKALGPAYDNGNVPQQWKAVLDQWHRQGVLPVNGRDVQFFFSSYNVLDLSAQRSSCAALIQDNGVFAVVGVAYFSVGADCVAREYHTPLLTGDGPGADVFQQGAPYLFSIDASSDRTMENMLYWADGRGLLKGKRIGLYYANDGLEPQLVDRSIRPTLAHLGYKIASESTTSAQDTNGGPEDAVAVQRFRSANVDLAILLTSKTGFLQAASAQQYRPGYIDNDFLYGTSDTTTSTYPSSEWDGTPALTTSHRGEPAAGMPLTAGQEACLKNYERYSGTSVPRPSTTSKETAAYAYILTACDEGNLLLDAIRGAGRGLTFPSLIGSFNAVRNRPLLRWQAISFTPTRHDGADQGRTLIWRASCTCWVAQGSFSPLPVR